MDLGATTVIAIALGADALSMAVGLGTAGIPRKVAGTIVATVLVMHIIMPLIGLRVGLALGAAIGNLATALSFVILVYLGGKMIWNVWHGIPGIGNGSYELLKRPLRVPPLLGSRLASGGSSGSVIASGLGAVLILGASVSMDALSAGFGLGVLGGKIWQTVLVFGLVAGSMTALGFSLGRGVGKWLGQKAQLVGGLILLLMALHLAWG